MSHILFALWFFAPAGLANAAPVFAAKLAYLNHFSTPLDLGHSWRGERIFGNHKTIRGVLAGMVLATLGVGLQKYAYTHSGWAVQVSQYVDYRSAQLWLLGPLLGFGALMGDAIKSFFKRRVHVRPGRSWFPFDQLDFIVGGLLASRLVVRLRLVDYAWVLGVWFLGHLAGAYTGYLIRLKDKPI